ncbi:MAG: zf-HC2 domain-containing protein, partial [Firmicutes bacterium]|nr:zf-HC2 domain-containing protein [Bacillota bacterium]
MNSKLPCHIVKDLLPNYADGLLSPESEAEVKAHLEECEACRAVYRQMTEPEPEPQISEDAAEVDYLKKYKRRRKSILIAAVVFALLIAGAAAINAKIQAAKADISYDEASKTMVVYGKDDTNLRLPDTIREATELDAQFDTFHVRVNLPMLRTDGLDLAEYLPSYLGGTNESLKFIRNYLKENCPEIDLADRASKYVDLTILPNGNYTWSEDEDRIALDI